MATRGLERTGRDLLSRWTMAYKSSTSTRFSIARPCLPDLTTSASSTTRTVVARRGLATSVKDNTNASASKLEPLSNETTAPAKKQDPPPRLTFDRRLLYLQGSYRYRTFDDALTNTDKAIVNTSANTQDPGNTKDKSTFRKRPRKSGKRYRPGFRPGDFMCPQCGTHNHRPPEYNLYTRSTSPSNLFPVDAETGSDGHGSSSDHTSTTKRFPAGALPRCFECGYETRIPVATALSSKSSTRSSESDSVTDNADAQEEDDDLRRSKPRDYVCCKCQALNLGSRLHCVGCGSIRPRVRRSLFGRRK
ncbi:hypothetical protein BGZ83_003753 [Gryganskiella cystojenkinii]|nr:hypothetical protein BGZ83_003753 [Gryganskiella cystojenkinii]